MKPCLQFNFIGKCVEKYMQYVAAVFTFFTSILSSNSGPCAILSYLPFCVFLVASSSPRSTSSLLMLSTLLTFGILFELKPCL